MLHQNQFNQLPEKIAGCLFISILLLSTACKKEENEVINLPLKPSPETPTSMNGKKLDFMGCIEVASHTIKIELWDSTKPDEDSFSLHLNGREVYLGEAFSEQKKLVIEEELDYFGYNRLIYYPHTLGKFSYNSATVVINGNSRELRSTQMTAGYLDIVYAQNHVKCESEEGSFTDLTIWTGSPITVCNKVWVHLSGNGLELDSEIFYYYSGIIPDCGSVGCANFENLPKGTYTYSGCSITQGTFELDGTPKCRKLQVQL